jgi:hypothetical protein
VSALEKSLSARADKHTQKGTQSRAGAGVGAEVYLQHLVHTHRHTQEHGHAAAFDPKLADFSGMDGKKDLYIGIVIQKAFVAVDEEGTEVGVANRGSHDANERDATANIKDIPR